MRVLLLILLTLAALPASATYTKMANNGAELPDSAYLGSGATDWACSRDNATGYIWEVKTTSGLRNQSKQWFDNNADRHPGRRQRFRQLGRRVQRQYGADLHRYDG